MKFFHVYNEDCFKGLEKNALLNKDTGFKIQHAFTVPAEKKFNQFAAKGTKLFNMIKKEIFRFAGEKSFGYGIIPHWIPVSFEGCKALKDSGAKLVAVSVGEKIPSEEPMIQGILPWFPCSLTAGSEVRATLTLFSPLF